MFSLLFCFACGVFCLFDCGLFVLFWDLLLFCGFITLLWLLCMLPVFDDYAIVLVSCGCFAFCGGCLLGYYLLCLFGRTCYFAYLAGCLTLLLVFCALVCILLFAFVWIWLYLRFAFRFAVVWLIGLLFVYWFCLILSIVCCFDVWFVYFAGLLLLC